MHICYKGKDRWLALAVCILGVVFSVLCFSGVFTSDLIISVLYGCIVLLGALLILAWYIKTFKSCYDVDENGITFTTPFYKRNIRWSECRFIGETMQTGRRAARMVVCSRASKPHNGNSSIPVDVHWPIKDTIQFERSLLDENGYRKFLSLCGGEKNQ